MYLARAGMRSGPARVRRILPHLMDLALTRQIDPDKAFDLEMSFSDATEGYKAMDEPRHQERSCASDTPFFDGR